MRNASQSTESIFIKISLTQPLHSAMKKSLLIVVFSLLAFCGNAQTNEQILIGKKETIYSKILQENRKVWMYAPGNTSTFSDLQKIIPVLYVLDGDAHFYSTVGIVQQLSQANGNGILPEMLVVGIENSNRLRDLSPSADPANRNPFLDFISTELMPFVERNYKVAPYKILIGHSLGGLTAIDILCHYPDMFNAYIAIDPSMWYNQEKHLTSAMTKLPGLKLNGKSLYLATANTMPVGMTLAKLKTDRSEETRHIRSIFAFDKFLKGHTNGMHYAQKFYEQETHNSLPMLATYDGLKHIFHYYPFKASEKDFADSTALIATRLKAHYTRISRELGYANAAPEFFVQYLGQDALSKKHLKKAGALFSLNVEGYPNSSSVYSDYADYFLATGDTSQALAQYKKSLQLKPDASTQRKLDALTRKNNVILNTEQLQKYAGNYLLEAFNLMMQLNIRDGKLWAIVPGQADSELVPLSEHVFTVRGKESYEISFEMKGDEPVKFTSVQPNGTFVALFKGK